MVRASLMTGRTRLMGITTTREFVQKAHELRGDRYDYSGVSYVTTYTPVTIICPIHGPFEQTPHKHLFGNKGHPTIGCPECKKNQPPKPIDPNKSLAATHPGLLSEWHPDNRVQPDEILAGSRLKILWICPKQHVWEARLSSRTRRNGSGCPHCAGRSRSGRPGRPHKVYPDRSFATIHPELLDEWDCSNSIKPTEISYAASSEVRWICRNDPTHIWTAKIANRHAGTGCPFCRGRSVDINNCVGVTHPYLLKEWHPDNRISPMELVAGSAKRIKWLCSNDPTHVWTTPLNSRARGRNGCPYCGRRRPTPSTSLAATHPHIAQEWHPFNTFSPMDVMSGSHKRALFVCSNNPDHVWSTIINNRTREDHQTGCPFCSGRKAEPTTCLAVTHPELLQEWHPDNKISPDEVKPGSGKRALWICGKNPEHIWSTPIYNRAVRGTGCPKCAEEAGGAFLIQLGITQKYGDIEDIIRREEERD